MAGDEGLWGMRTCWKQLPPIFCPPSRIMTPFLGPQSSSPSPPSKGASHQHGSRCRQVGQQQLSLRWTHHNVPFPTLYQHHTMPKCPHMTVQRT